MSEVDMDSPQVLEEHINTIAFLQVGIDAKGVKLSRGHYRRCRHEVDCLMTSDRRDS